MKSIKYLVIALAGLGLCSSAISSCRGKETARITGTTARVADVIDGNTIKLSTNLTVNLIGVEDNAESKKFLLRNVKGKKVELVADSKDAKQSYTKGSNDRVNAYVNVIGDRSLNSVNGRMVRTGVCRINMKGATDSIDRFKNEGMQAAMSHAEILAFLKPRTFLILHPDGSLGTGFYISSTGVALTNAHVLNRENAQGSKIVPFTDDGGYDMTNYHEIERLICVGSEEQTQTDYCIFEVSLNGNKVPFLKLASKPELDGNEVWKLGCVSGEPAHFSNGVISHTLDGVITHSSKTNQGDSGSPLVNKYGEVIGINQSLIVNPNIGGDVGVYYAVDIQILRDWFENHRDDQGQLRYGR